MSIKQRRQEILVALFPVILAATSLILAASALDISFSVGEDVFSSPSNMTPVDGIRCDSIEFTKFHIHAHLDIFVDGKPLVNECESLQDIPAKTPLADTISKDMKARGFKFVRPTIIYAHMQATGIVNDHLIDCDRWKEVQGL